jgi:CRISPR-associated protein Cmr5
MVSYEKFKIKRRSKVIKTLEQERASFCIKKVSSVTLNKDKYKSHARDLPSFIISNGLIPTLAFYKKGERKPVYDTINEWLKEKVLIKKDALEELAKSDFQPLRIATMEVLAIANWLKRIVEVEIKNDKK